MSVDLDEVPCYAAIHGLDVPEAARHAVYRRAVPRFAALFASEGIPATFFVIGRDAEEPENAATLRQLHAAGHELGNHTYDHLYDLTRHDVDAVAREVCRGADAIEAAAGARPVGFRAPGYTITDAVMQVLSDHEYAYDSSVFPCPAYYGAKLAALAVMAVRGRRSHSIVDDPRVLLAPADPYRVGWPFYAPGSGLLELPIGVTRGSSGRLPYIGTSLVLAGERGAGWLTRRIEGRPFVNLELHGIDLADADEDGLAFLRPHQPDLRKRRADKEAALRAAFAHLRRAGYRFVTLANAAQTLGAV